MDAIRGLAGNAGATASALGLDPSGTGSGRAASPFYVSTVPHLDVPGNWRSSLSDEAWTLARLYRSVLDIIQEAQELLEADQERLALLLADAQGRNDDELDVLIVFLQEGLELRLREHTEECRRLSQVERRLRYALEDAEAKCEIDALRASGLVDQRLLEKLIDQRRVIALQRSTLDQMRFERDILEDEAARLRESAATFEQGDAFGEDGLEVKARPDDYEIEDVVAATNVREPPTYVPEAAATPSWAVAASGASVSTPKSPKSATSRGGGFVFAGKTPAQIAAEVGI